MASAGIDVVFDKVLLDAGVKRYLQIQLDSASYLLFGPSGSGKSVLSKLFCGRISTNIIDSKIWLCDEKAYDYRFLRNVPNARYWEYLDMAEGIQDFFEMMERRITGEETEDADGKYSYRLIVLEEWSNYLRIQTKLDKANKTQIAQTSLSQLFSITSQGRAYNCHALVNLQRPDASFLEGFRENLTVVIGLGRISPQAAMMVGFTDYPEFSGISGGLGMGWMVTDEGSLSQVRVPFIRAWDDLHNSIISAVTR